MSEAGSHLDAADDRETLARLRGLMPNALSSRQRRMLRSAIAHVGQRLRGSRRS